jgi:hypothetical protein
MAYEESASQVGVSEDIEGRFCLQCDSYFVPEREDFLWCSWEHYERYWETRGGLYRRGYSNGADQAKREVLRRMLRAFIHDLETCAGSNPGRVS